MTASSGNLEENRRRDELKRLLSIGFDVYEEVSMTHALFKHRSVRADLVAFPKDKQFENCVLAFEVKGHEFWDVPSLSHALKQASDYVLGRIDQGQDFLSKEHIGMRVLGSFVYPFFSERNRNFGVSAADAFLMGMMQAAGASRVGSASIIETRDGPCLTLSVASSTVWCDGKGWRRTSLPILNGKRQIGSQRVNIMDELARIA